MLLPVFAAWVLDSSRLQIGTNWSGDETLHFVSKEAEIDETHVFKLAFRVTGVDNRMWIVERRGTLTATRIGDAEMPPPPYKEPAITKEWLSPAGFLLDAEPLEPGAFNLDRLITYWLPKNEPDTWSVDLSTTVTHNIIKGRAEFKVKGKPNRAVSEYTFSFSSAEINASGTMWFQLGTGRLLQAEIKAQRAQLPGSTERANVEVTYIDSQVKKNADGG